jgi:hypothetical protein
MRARSIAGTLGVFAALSLSTGCVVPHLVAVRIDEPAGAHVTIPRGVKTPKVEINTPLVGRFEPTHGFIGHSLWFDLDEAAAAHYGGTRATRLYGRLLVKGRTWKTFGEVLNIAPTHEHMRALLRGELTEIYAPAHAHVPCGKCQESGEVVAVLVLSTKPI